MSAAIFCGSRYWAMGHDDDANAEHALLVHVVQQFVEAGSGKADAPIVIHGAAPGADALAGRVARAAGANVVAMPAQWRKLSRAGGPARNREMLNVLLALGNCGHAIEVHAFPKAEARGTRNMIELALDAGVSTYLHSFGEQGESRTELIRWAVKATATEDT